MSWLVCIIIIMIFVIFLLKRSFQEKNKSVRFIDIDKLLNFVP